MYSMALFKPFYVIFIIMVLQTDPSQFRLNFSVDTETQDLIAQIFT